MLRTIAFVTPLILSLLAFVDAPQAQTQDQSAPQGTGNATAKKTHKHAASAKPYEGPQEQALDRGEEPVSSAKPDPQAGETAKLNGGY